MSKILPMNILLPLLGLMFLVGCATKYIAPTNRFITPEAQGGMFRGQFEMQQTKGTEMTIDTSNNSVDDGVTYSTIPRTGYMVASSLLETVDLIWSHVGGANSMLGAKFQFVGASRTGGGAGHKAAIAGLVGGNEHETDDRSVEFKLSGQEILLLYGYRLTENVMPYSSFSYAKFNFEGEIKKPAALSGLEPSMETTAKSLSGGVELDFQAVFAKAECTYQQLSTTDSEDKNQFTFGFSVGLAW